MAIVGKDSFDRLRVSRELSPADGFDNSYTGLLKLRPMVGLSSAFDDDVAYDVL